MENTQITNGEYDYLESQFRKIEGIGKAGAGKIISLVNQFEEVENITEDDIINNIKRSSGNPYFKKEHRKQIINIINNIDFSKDITTLVVEEIIADFIRKTFEKIMELELDILDINPFLVRALKFDEAEEVILFYLYQRITRSIVTSWGMTVENIALATGATKVPQKENVVDNGKKFDVKKIKDGKKYYIQIKTGPNTMNVGMVESLNTMIRKVEERDENSVGLLGMTFGTQKQLSSQISGNLTKVKEHSLIGSEFWDFISEKNGFTEELLDIIDDAAKIYQEKAGGKKLSDIIDEKYELLLNEWEEKYKGKGKDSIKMVEKLNL
ncbi:MAG: TdeIII family type II restriction endonuclease [bacterium]